MEGAKRKLPRQNTPSWMAWRITGPPHPIGRIVCRGDDYPCRSGDDSWRYCRLPCTTCCHGERLLRLRTVSFPLRTRDLFSCNLPFVRRLGDQDVPYSFQRVTGVVLMTTDFARIFGRRFSNNSISKRERFRLTAMLESLGRAGRTFLFINPKNRECEE
jgi:hypothetical protein